MSWYGRLYAQDDPKPSRTITFDPNAEWFEYNPGGDSPIKKKVIEDGIDPLEDVIHDLHIVYRAVKWEKDSPHPQYGTTHPTNIVEDKETGVKRVGGKFSEFPRENDRQETAKEGLGKKK